jgi:hypothetical protein
MNGTEKRALQARMDALEASDPWQGVRLTGVAKMLPMQGGVGPWTIPLEFTAHCDTCEWGALLSGVDLGGSFSLGFGSADLLRVQSWPASHLMNGAHKKAWELFCSQP